MNMNKITFFAPAEDKIVADVTVFLNKEFPLLKTPESWKAGILDELAHQELQSSIKELKNAEVAKFTTICGRTMAEILLNNLPNDYKPDREILTEKFFIQILSKAVKIVFDESSKYDESNFVEGFYNNVKELLYTEIKKAEKTQEQPNQKNSDDSDKKAAPDKQETSGNHESCKGCNEGCGKSDEDKHCRCNSLGRQPVLIIKIH